MSSSSSVLAPLSLSHNAGVRTWRGARTGLVFFLFISFYTLILNISLSLSHIVPTHVLDNCPTPFKIVLTYTSTSRVNAFRRLLVSFLDCVFCEAFQSYDVESHGYHVWIRLIQTNFNTVNVVLAFDSVWIWKWLFNYSKYTIYCDSYILQIRRRCKES